MGQPPISIRVSDSCPYSCIEVIENYLLPSFANNNDLVSYISYRYLNTLYAYWEIDIYANGEHLSASCSDGLNIRISSKVYESTFESLSLNLADYRTANEVYTDKDLFFFYADTGERIWARR